MARRNNRSRSNRARNVDLLSFQGSGGQAGMLGGYAIQQALSSGLTARQIRDLATKQGLQINQKGYDFLAGSKQQGNKIDLKQFQGADAQSNILGGYAVQQALNRGLSRKDIKGLAEKQGFTINTKGLELLKEQGGGIRQAVNAAGPIISKSEMQNIVAAAGGNVAKALNQIAKVQANIKGAGGQAPSVASGAANMLIRQASRATPQQLGYQPFNFGTSKLGQTLQSMLGTPSYAGAMIQGQRVGGTVGSPMQLVPGGDVIRPSGNIRNRPPQTIVNNVPFDTTALDQQIATLTDQVNTLTNQATTAPGNFVPDETTGFDMTSFINDLISQPVAAPQFQGYGDLFGGTFDYGAPAGGMGAVSGFDMTPLTNLFASQPVLQSDTAMEQAMQEMEITDPIQLDDIGRSYASGIRGRTRPTKSRGMYRRNDMAIQSPKASPKKLVGGLTL